MASTSNDGPILLAEQPPEQRRTTKRRPTPPPPAAAVAVADPDEDEDDEDEPAAAAPAGKGRTIKAKKSALTITPPIPLRRHNEDFWNWLGNASSDDWNYLIVYLWRGDPIFNSKYGNKMSNIRKIAAPFDLDDVKKWEGSGGYRVDVVGLDRVTKARERIDQEYFTINDPDFPPRLPLGPWVDFPENQEAWGWCKAILQDRQASTATPGNSNPGNVADVVRETVSALKDSQSDPVRDNLYNRLLEKALNPPPVPPAAATPNAELKEVLYLMLAQEKEARGRIEAEMKELRKALTESKSSAGQLENELTQQVRIKNLVRQLAGKAETPSEPESEWIGVAKTALEKLPEAISLFQLGRRPQPQQRPQQQQQPTAAPAVEAGQQPTQGNEEVQAKYIQALAKHQPLLMKIVPFLNDYFVNELGTPELPLGVAFRDWFFPRYGQETWRQLQKDLPAEAIAEVIAATPQLAETLQPPQKVLEFLNGFYSEPTPEPAAGVN